MHRFLFLLCCWTAYSAAFVMVAPSSSSSSPLRPSAFTTTTTTGIIITARSRTVLALAAAPTPVHQVEIWENAEEVGARVRAIVQTAAQQAIAERGHFALAIPGGSILKMLATTTPPSGDWTSKTTVAYVNHKCVPMDDVTLATHAKARQLFLDQWTGVNVVTLDGTDNGPAEAQAYQAKLQALVDANNILPVNNANGGVPQFDLALIGVGDDGHIGSLYPHRPEVLETTDWVLSVAMKSPPSITLSLPVMASARQVIVAACGVSDKYPQGKSEGMRRAVVAPEETLESFPAVGLRPVATWVMDRAAASKLGSEYGVVMSP